MSDMLETFTVHVREVDKDVQLTWDEPNTYICKCRPTKTQTRLEYVVELGVDAFESIFHSDWKQIDVFFHPIHETEAGIPVIFTLLEDDWSKTRVPVLYRTAEKVKIGNSEDTAWRCVSDPVDEPDKKENKDEDSH